MSSPRRPKKEPPAVTIRWQSRQMATMQREIIRLRRVNDSNEQRVTAQDVELSEAADREEILLREGDEVAEKYGQLLARHARDSLRRQFLEGYYHAKTEALPGSRA